MHEILVQFLGWEVPCRRDRLPMPIKERSFPDGSAVKKSPAMQETQVEFLGLGGFLEEEMATHSSILTWKIPWIEEPSRLQSTGSQRVGHD